MKKRMISLFLVLALAVGICPAAFAAEETKSSTILSSKEESNNLLRYGEREVIEVVETATKSVETTPTGQPSGGYSFPSYGGSVYIQTSGGGEISVGLSVSWDPAYSISISKGLASDKPSAAGLCVNFPANSNHYIVKLKHTYIVKHLKIDYYRGPDYLSTSYVTKHELKSIDAFLERV